MVPPYDDSTGLHEQAQRHLRALVGSEEAMFREDQWRAVEALVVNRRRALVVQRTGWGKSAVYFVATALLRAAGAGPTVIISPLLALMRNQIAAAEHAGIRAVTVNSTNPEQWQQIYAAIGAGEVDVLLVSPERLNNPDFRDVVLPDLAASAGLLVVDEAHCISDWGHDFRPDYRRIGQLLRTLPAGIPVLATTATANARVVTDVAEQLSVTGTQTLDDVLVLRGSLDRESLHLAVVETADEVERLAWLADHLRDLPGSGIIYCLTVAAATDVAHFLTSRGYDVQAYSGRSDPAERLAAEEDLLHNRVKALVATSALGMGFDKPDLGFVIHLGAPPSPIAYYQQVGRAGRAVESADVILLPGAEDPRIWEYFAAQGFPAEEHVRQTLEVLDSADRPLSTAALETRVPLRRGRLETMLKVLDVDDAVRRVRGGWVAGGTAWVYDAERYRRVADARRAEQQAMLAYEQTTDCRLQYLRDQLDDPTASGPCGRCDTCGGLKLSAQTTTASRDAATEHLRAPGVPVAVKKRWPTGMEHLGIELRGTIAEEVRAEPGWAVARLTDLGYGSRLRELFDPGAPDQQVPVPLRHALAEVFDAWEWEPGEQPTGVVGLTSHHRPLLVDHLTDGMARYTGLPVLTRVSSAAPGATASTGNSAHRLAEVTARLSLHAASSVAGHRVLLLDDRTDTGWTFTVTAKLLREAGAERVYPLALAAVT